MTSVQSALQRAEKLRLRVITDCVADTEMTWQSFKFGQVIGSLRNGMYVSRPGTAPAGVPILRIGSVRALRLNVTDIRYSGMSADEVKKQGYLLEPGDLLFTRYNGNPEYVGACAIVPEGIGSLTYPDKLIRVRVDKSLVLPEFLALVCSAGEARTAIRRSVKTTAGQTGISGRELKSIPIRLPTLSEQAQKIRQFADCEKVLRRLEIALKPTSTQALMLHRSLLREAFGGRLVQQNSTDVPASELLGDIREEHMAEKVRRSRRIRNPRVPQEEMLI